MEEQALVPVGDKALLPVVKRPRGRPRRDRPVTEKLLPVLDIDFTMDPADQVLPCTEREQAKHLNWYVPEVKSTNQTLGLYKNLPMICQASGCHWASQCPTNPDFIFQGRPCPLEVIQAFRLFVGYVREMGATPNDSVDLDLIGELVRIQIQIQRIDQQLQVQGMLVDSVGGIAQQKGTAIWEKAQHPLLVHQSRLRDDRNRIHKSLIVSREGKKKVEQVEGKQKMDALSIMMQFRKMSEEALQGDGPKALPSAGTPFDFIPSHTLEGSVVEPDDDDYDEE
jgi:hypothetical protein